MARDIKKMTEAFDNLQPETKGFMGKLQKLIDKCAMDPAEVEEIVESSATAEKFHPEITAVEGMSCKEYADIYKKYSEDIKVNPEKYAKHVEFSGMTEDELSVLWAEINGAVEKYPEVWESQEAAQMLSPKNLSILVHALKNDK